jgi:hypothetical protein
LKDAFAAIWVGAGATATFVNCTFADNSIYPSDYSGMLSVAATDPSSPFALPQDTIVRLQQCTFTANSAEDLLVTYEASGGDSEHSAHIYSDDASLKVRQISHDRDEQEWAEPLSAAPVGRQGINSKSTWLLTAQQVRSATAS